MTLEARAINLFNIPSFKLRDADEAECLAGGMTGELAVRRSVAGSIASYAHYLDGELLCLWGYRWNNTNDKTVTMWLLSTDAVDLHKLAFGRATKRILRMLDREIAEITVLVHNDYEQAIKWLTWLGFERARTITKTFTEFKREKR